MSKERLEEFREFVDFMYESIDIEDHQRFIAISDSMLNDGWFKWIYRLAKEQAERVQELEEDYEYLSHHYGNETEQNKRYREALEFVNEELEHVLHSNKSLPVKMFYIENSKRKITETLEDEQ